LKKGEKIDITTARSEYYPYAGSLPEIKYSRLQNDLFRRDFSINSLAIQINSKDFGKLFDYFGGRRDLKLGIIRVLNNFSFVEDPIRILRSIRFEQRFGFSIEDKTKYLLRKSLQSFNLKKVSAERIRAELVYSCKKGAVDKFFSRLEELEILRQINRNVVYTVENKDICRRMNEIIIWFRNTFPKEEIENWICYHLVLINGLTLRIKEKFARSLKYPAYFMVAIRKTDNYIRNVLPYLSDDRGELAISLKNMSLETILFLIAYISDKEIRDKFVRYLTYDRFIKEKLNGHNIMELGVPESELVGILLNKLRIAKINNLLNSVDDEIQYIKHYLDKHPL